METIAPATRDDLSELADLLAILFTQEAEFAADRDKQLRGLEMILRSPQAGQIFVARDGDTIAGMVSVLHSISTAEGAPDTWLEDLIVRPEYRGGGLGSRLIEAAISAAAANGSKRITLLTDADNEGAQRLYQRHAFRRSTMVMMRRPIE